MANFRVSYLYSQRASRIAGWSENFWCVRTSLEGAIETATTLAQLLVPIHGDNTSLDNIRVSEVPKTRQTRLVAMTNVAQALNKATPQESDYPTTALLIELENVDQVTTRQWIKGIWDTVVVNGGVYGGDGGYTKKLEAVFKYLISNNSGFCNRVLDTATNPLTVVTAFNNATGVVTAPGHNLVPGDKMRISGVRPTLRNPLNKIWRVSAVTVDTVTLIDWIPIVGYAPLLVNAKMQRQSYILRDIVNCRFLRISKRNVGRPFAVLGGSRRRR